MKSRIKLSDLRDRIEIYSVTSQSNATTKLPEDTRKLLGCYYAKIEMITRVVEDDNKRMSEQIWNMFVRSQNCNQVTVECQIKWQGKYHEVVGIDTEDLYFNKIQVKRIK